MIVCTKNTFTLEEARKQTAC